ncbi:MAG: hypothetical protein Faunusvirus9_15, partial [Faunusvirus sp.]
TQYTIFINTYSIMTDTAQNIVAKDGKIKTKKVTDLDTYGVDTIKLRKLVKKRYSRLNDEVLGDLDKLIAIRYSFDEKFIDLLIANCAAYKYGNSGTYRGSDLLYPYVKILKYIAADTQLSVSQITKLYTEASAQQIFVKFIEILTGALISTAVFEYLCEHVSNISQYVAGGLPSDVVFTLCLPKCQPSVKCLQIMCQLFNDDKIDKIIAKNVMPDLACFVSAVKNTNVTSVTIDRFINEFKLIPDDNCLNAVLQYRDIDTVKKFKYLPTTECIINAVQYGSTNILQYLIDNCFDKEFDKLMLGEFNVAVFQAVIDRSNINNFNAVHRDGINNILTILADHGFKFDNQHLTSLFIHGFKLSTDLGCFKDSPQYNIVWNEAILLEALKTQSVDIIDAILARSNIVLNDLCFEELLLNNAANITVILELFIRNKFQFNINHFEQLIKKIGVKNINIDNFKIERDTQLLKIFCKKEIFSESNITRLLKDGVMPDIECLEEVCKLGNSYAYNSGSSIVFDKFIKDYKLKPSAVCITSVINNTYRHDLKLDQLLDAGADVDTECLEAYINKHGDKTMQKLFTAYKSMH